MLIILRKIFSVLTLIVSILMVVAMIMLTVYIIGYYYAVRSNPHASGIDYLGFLIYPVYFLPIALVGAVASGICIKTLTNKTVKTIAYLLLFLFMIVLMFVPLLILST